MVEKRCFYFVNFEQLLLFSIVGYLIDIVLNVVMVRFILKTEASVGSVAFFEWLHDSVTFIGGFILGLSIISISILHVGEDLAFTGVWLVISYFLARRILGFDSLPKTLGFLGFDTALDYGLGGLISVPAGLSLLSVVPVSSTAATHAAAAAPLSLRPLIIIIGAVIVLAIVAIRKKQGEDVDLVTEE